MDQATLEGFSAQLRDFGISICKQRDYAHLVRYPKRMAWEQRRFVYDYQPLIIVKNLKYYFRF